MTVNEFNIASNVVAAAELQRCCGAAAWVSGMLKHRPYATVHAIYSSADELWRSLTVSDWKEAFSHHPKIGDREDLRKKFASTSTWAEGEQRGVQNAALETIQKLAEGNEAYESKFGYIFIVCATGKTAEEMLGILNSRLPNDPVNEVRIAAEEQRKITRLRLEKLFSSPM